MPAIDDLFTPPNGPAYEKKEVRVGPPLEYVAEKMRHTVEQAYNTVRIVLGAEVSADLASHIPRFDLRELERNNQGFRTAKATMRYAVHAYVALQNMLGAMNDDSLIERLIMGTSADLEAWLDRVEQEGSVLG